MHDEEAMRRVVKETVHETLSGLGFDTHNLAEMQADMVYLRHLRKGSEDVFSKIRLVLLTTTIPGILYLLWEAFKNKIKNG